MILAPKKQEIAPKMNMVCWSENFIMRRNRKTINQTQNSYTPLPKHGKMMMALYNSTETTRHNSLSNNAFSGSTEKTK
jgi:hypothetical protein